HAYQKLMGNKVFLNVIYVQAALDSHHQIVAVEELKILMHLNECQDPTSCNEDRHIIWWNGMGQLLLDGRNPQPYNDTIKHFKELQF
ncbi:hypothetical protein BDR06DRAFT_844926, partial [Suillus hirtellus]